ncbi:unnamed protein product [Mortierella alpina]
MWALTGRAQFFQTDRVKIGQKSINYTFTQEETDFPVVDAVPAAALVGITELDVEFQKTPVRPTIILIKEDPSSAPDADTPGADPAWIPAVPVECRCSPRPSNAPQGSLELAVRWLDSEAVLNVPVYEFNS